MKKFITKLSYATFSFFMLFSIHSYSAENFSGFLSDYSRLAETKDYAGEKVLRFISPKIYASDYHHFMIEPVQFFPEPQPNEQVQADALNEISAYFDQALKEKLGQKMTLTNEAGPGVLKIRPAITAVASQKQKLKPYQYVPAAFVITTILGRAQEATIQMEVEVVDSVTGEQLAATIRKGTGAKLDKNKKLNLMSVSNTLDKWIDAGATVLSEK